MAAVDDLDEVLEQWHPASNEFLKVNLEPAINYGPIGKTSASPTLWPSSAWVGAGC